MVIGSYENIAKVLDEINGNELVLISGHKNSDMDSIASSLSLTRYLNRLGKNAICLLEEKSLELLKWYNNYEYIITSNDMIKEPYTFILVDANEKSRLGTFENFFDRAKLTIQIDHHENNEGLANHILVDTSISSTSEMIYNITSKLDLEIDKSTAELLYAGILSDTCCFTRRMTSQTFMVLSNLLKYNIEYDRIAKQTYLNKSIEELRITGKAINELTIDDDVAYAIIDKKENAYKNINYNTFSKKILTSLNNIDNINIIVGMLVDDEKVEIIIRSHTIIIEPILKKFGGGGHKYAAGATIYNKNVNTIISDIQNEILKLKSTSK